MDKQKQLQENLTSQVNTIMTIFIKLLVENNLIFSVDRQGNIYFKERHSNFGASITSDTLNSIYNQQLEIKEGNNER